jgi:uncharacterized protein YkwD
MVEYGKGSVMVTHEIAVLHALRRTALIAIIWLGLACAALAIAVNPQNRMQSLLFYQNSYLSTAGVPIGWTGSHATCNAGTTSLAFRQAVIARVNYFRAMAGVPAEIALNETWSSRAQKAALMMSRNNALSHSPPSTWHCYTAEGAEAASKSNLALGYNGVDVIDAYIKDIGSNNASVGHRRWIFHPQSVAMGTGDVPAAGSYNSANALWVVDNDTFFDPRPTTREPYVAWPPPGYVPYQVTYPRWSFTLPNADFSGAAVAMTENGLPVSVALDSFAGGIGDPTIVWIPKGMNNGATWPRPSSDVNFEVTITNVLVSGLPQTFTYDVNVFDPTLVSGDFNNNGAVDAADYVVWRKGAGVTPSPANYTLWRTNFGRSGGGSAGAEGVPESASWLLLAIAAFLIAANSQRPRSMALAPMLAKNTTCGPIES